MCKFILKYLILESRKSSYYNFFEDICWVLYRWLLLQNCCATSNHKTHWPGAIGKYSPRVHLCCSADLNWACCCLCGWSRAQQVCTRAPHLEPFCSLYPAFSSSSCKWPSHVMSGGQQHRGQTHQCFASVLSHGICKHAIGHSQLQAQAKVWGIVPCPQQEGPVKLHAKVWVPVGKNDWGHSYECLMWESLASLSTGNTNVGGFAT